MNFLFFLIFRKILSYPKHLRKKNFGYLHTIRMAGAQSSFKFDEVTIINLTLLKRLKLPTSTKFGIRVFYNTKTAY